MATSIRKIAATVLRPERSSRSPRDERRLCPGQRDDRGGRHGRLLRSEIQNENLAALRDGEVLASVPDIISVLDSATGEVVVTERLRYGRRVSVIAFASDPICAPKRAEAAGPTAFGYDFPFAPVPVKRSGR